MGVLRRWECPACGADVPSDTQDRPYTCPRNLAHRNVDPVLVRYVPEAEDKLLREDLDVALRTADTAQRAVNLRQRDKEKAEAEVKLLREDRDSWRRVAERLQAENADHARRLDAVIAQLEAERNA